MTALVIGLGQPDRGDDAVGLLVAEEVRRSAPRVDVVTVMSPARLIDTWADREHVVVVDAVRTGGASGQVSVIEVGDRPLPARPGAGGSHGFGVAEAVELARALDRLPERLLIVGVEASAFGQGAGMTPAVAGAVGPAARAVLAELPVDAVEGGDA